MSTPISAAAAGARESSRTHTGQFGEQCRGESPEPAIVTTPDLDAMEEGAVSRRDSALSALKQAKAQVAEDATVLAAVRVQQFLHDDGMDPAATLRIVVAREDRDRDGGVTRVLFVPLNEDGSTMLAGSDSSYPWTENDGADPALQDHFGDEASQVDMEEWQVIKRLCDRFNGKALPSANGVELDMGALMAAARD